MRRYGLRAHPPQGRVRRRAPGGFVMMFTLIAVALAGLVMVETAPDFSNYAVLSRSQQFDTALARLRQVVSSRPFYLTTADGITGIAANDVLTPDEVEEAVSRLVVTSGSTVSSSDLTLGTTPVDPYVPAKEWGEVFWSASYNFVRDPAFYDLPRREARDPGAMTLFYLSGPGGITGIPNDGQGETTILRTGRFGREHQSLVSSGSEWRHLSVSPDGSRILAASDIRKDNTYDVVTSDRNGAARTFANATTFDDETLPEWSPRGDRVSFRRELADATLRMVIKGPELESVELDPIEDTQGTANEIPVGSIDDMGPGIFSPNGKYLAFWVRDIALGASTAYILVYDVSREQFLIPSPIGADGGVAYASSGSCVACPTAKRFTPIAWHPDSTSFLYVDDTSSDIVQARNIPLGAAAYTDGVDMQTSFTNAHALAWIPLSSPGSGVTSATAFLAVTPDGPDASVGAIHRRRITDPPGQDYRLAEAVYTGFQGGVQKSYRTLALSPGGTAVAFIEENQGKVMIMGPDGSRLRELFDLATDAQRPGEVVDEVVFQRPSPAWSYSPVAVKRVTRSSLAAFDQRGWREFTQTEAMYPGDSRFGNGYLRVEPPPNAGQFLFDNSEGILRIDRDNPTRKVAPIIPQKVEPTWGWRNVNYIARESSDITGGFPSDTFKQPIAGGAGGGTTVLVTTGTAPAYGPDNKQLAVSKLMSDHTTYPANTTVFPPVDTDIWVVEANGAPDPPPRNLTPSTTATAEGAPAFSPDSRFVYFQRESQQTSKFLGNHSSGIYRVTASGGAVTQIVGEGSIDPAWRGTYYVSSLEFYQPAVSPDGTRLAFIAKERLLGLGSLGPNISTTRVGEVIGEALYVKDLLFNAAPVCLLRSYDSEIGQRMTALGSSKYLPRLLDGTQATAGNSMTGTDSYADHSFWRPTWSANGEEIYLTRTWPRNRWFPKKDFYRSGQVGNNEEYRKMIERSQLLAVKVTHPRPNPVSSSTAIQALGDGSYDPPADNFRVVLRNVSDGGHPGGHQTNYEIDPGSDLWDAVGGYDPDLAFDWSDAGQGDPDDGSPQNQLDRYRRNILNAVPATDAYAVQRISKDGSSARNLGIQLNTDYVLSGYVRTQGGVGGLHAGQIMLQLLNGQGLLVSLAGVTTDVYQMGLADIGGNAWTRFSAGVNFRLDPNDRTQLKGHTAPQLLNWGDNPPFSAALMIYTLGGVGSVAEFTGIKMERAFDPRTMAPTVFNPGWVIHSSSKLPDPRRPDALIFER